MTTAELISEFDRDMESTQRILERVPEERFAWRPHERSSTLGLLANHVAVLPVMVAAVIQGSAKRLPEARTSIDLMAAFAQSVAAGRDAIAGANVRSNGSGKPGRGS